MNQNQNYSATNSVSQQDLSLYHETQEYDPYQANVHYQQNYSQRGRGYGRGFPRDRPYGRPGGRGQGPRGRGGYSSARFSDCEYCYVQAKVHGKSVDFKHNIKSCPQLRQVFQPAVHSVNELYEGEESHPFNQAFDSSDYDNQYSYTEEEQFCGDQ